jgi:hypothetical protein
MEKLDILIWAIGGGFGITFIILKMIFSRFDKIDDKFEKINERFNQFDRRFNQVENRLTAIETILHMKECCVIKDERKLPKAE